MKNLLKKQLVSYVSQADLGHDDVYDDLNGNRKNPSFLIICNQINKTSFRKNNNQLDCYIVC